MFGTYGLGLKCQIESTYQPTKQGNNHENGYHVFPHDLVITKISRNVFEFGIFTEDKTSYWNFPYLDMPNQINLVLVQCA